MYYILFEIRLFFNPKVRQSKLNLCANFKNPIRRKIEVIGRLAGITRHKNIQLVPPRTHPDRFRWDQGRSPQEKGGSIHIDFNIPVIDHPHDRRNIRPVHETISDKHPVKTLLHSLEFDPVFGTHIRHFFNPN